MPRIYKQVYLVKLSDFFFRIPTMPNEHKHMNLKQMRRLQNNDGFFIFFNYQANNTGLHKNVL